MKKISLFFVSVIIFTGLVILQTTANANEGAVRRDSGVRSFFDGSRLFISSQVKIELTKTGTDEPGGIFYSINNGEEIEYSEPFAIEEEGAHTIVYYSVDQLGNRETPKILTVFVDNAPPDVAVSIVAPFSKQEDVIYAAESFSYQYTINAKDDASGVSSVRYSVGEAEDAVQKHYLEPFVINSLEPVKLNIFAEDRVGNTTSQYTANIYDENGNLIATGDEELNIVVDNTPPEVTITPDKEFFMRGDVQVASREHKFTITATDEESGVKAIYYRLGDDSRFILYTGQEISFSTNGPQKIEAIAVDNVGNTSSGTSLEFIIDLIPANTQLRLVSE